MKFISKVNAKFSLAAEVLLDKMIHIMSLRGNGINY